MKENSELYKIFNVRNDDAPSIIMSDIIKKYLTEQDLKKLIERHSEMKSQKSFNISNKKTEDQKVIRLKNESAIIISQLNEELNKIGLNLPLALLADYLILKAVNKL